MSQPTNKEIFESKYVNFQNFINTLKFVEYAKDTPPITNITCKVFIAGIQPYANQQNLDEIKNILNLLDNKDFDEEDAATLVLRLFTVVPLIGSMVTINTKEVSKEDATKFCRYMHLFMKLLL